MIILTKSTLSRTMPTDWPCISELAWPRYRRIIKIIMPRPLKELDFVDTPRQQENNIFVNYELSLFGKSIQSTEAFIIRPHGLLTDRDRSGDASLA